MIRVHKVSYKTEVHQFSDAQLPITAESPREMGERGRFREFYYWDSYWIIKGLLLSEMHATATGMVTNFLDIVDRYGFIPNGGRIYYLMRSQPPLLIPMVKLLMEDIGDIDFLKQHIGTMDKEFDFWIKNHTVEVDYNGRKSIIPVDLNAFMCWNAQLMAEFHELLENFEKAKYYKMMHAKFKEAIEHVLWHEDVGAWLDFNLESGRRRDYFYPSNIVPLWTGCYDVERSDYYVNRVINYLEKVKYDATIFGGFGGGGEYVVQKGFGWTNGVVMALLNLYGAWEGDNYIPEDRYPASISYISALSTLRALAQK
ncbi:jg8790 [Pararge aegeria aegeria]|uniref:Trehalase n=1 Tax=Pararge aegeria aegeria TaxID=348720 RepID=A0A8S4S7D8_9NEOP|nr:jg8790 [Pararge aegeria aegeria]